MAAGQDIWPFRTLHEDGVVALKGLGVELPLDAIYANLERVDAPDRAVAADG